MSKNDKGVAAFYDTVSQDFSASRKWPWPEMLPYLNILKRNDTVLDIGCGNGRILNGIKQKVDYLGVDFSRLLIAQAKKLHPKQRFVIGDILEPHTWNKLPKADVIFCVAVVHHIGKKDLSFLFKQFQSHLKKGGMLYLSTWNLWQIPYLKYHFSLRSLGLKVKDRDWRSVWVPFAGKHFRYCQAYTMSDVAKGLQASGLKQMASFFSQGNGYLNGKNLVLVCTKVS